MSDSKKPNADTGRNTDTTSGPAPVAGEELDRRLAALPTEAVPPAALWAGISRTISAAAKIDPPDSGPVSKTIPLDNPVSPDTKAPRLESAWVAGLSAIAATLTVFIILSSSSSDSLVPNAPFEPEGFAAVQSFKVAGMDTAQLAQVRSNLHSSLRLALDELAPETRETVVENLARIDAARAEIDKALQKDPANRLLKQMLLSSYTHEITLLNEFTVMASAASRRTQL